MENKINAKTTKAELIEIIREQEMALKAKESLVDDPVKEREETRKKGVLESAKEAVKTNIFSEEITNKYNNIVEATELKQKELKELYEIEHTANTVIALINGHKERKVALEQEMAEKKAALEKEYAERKAELEKEICDKRAEKVELIASIKEDVEELKANLEKERQREEEEYEYELQRKRKADSDKWTDEKTEREKAVANLERIANANMEEFMKKADYLAGLEAKVASIPDLITKAEDEAYAKGKAETKKAYDFEFNALKTKHEYAIRALEDQIGHLKEDNLVKVKTIENLQGKLDVAYDKIANVATTTVQSTGGVKILNATEEAKK